MIPRPNDLTTLVSGLKARHAASPGDRDLALKYGRLLVRVGQLREAVTVLERLVKSAPEDAAPRLVLVMALVKLGDVEAARFWLEPAVAGDPGNVSVLVALAAVAEAEGRVEEQVASLMRAVASDAKRVDLRLKLAELLRSHGDTSGARQQYEAILQEQPGHDQARFRLAAMKFAAGDLAGAVAEYRAHLQVHPEAIDVHFNLAICLLRQHQHQQAIGHLALVNRRQPTHPKAAWLLAESYEACGENDRAVVILEGLAERAAYAEMALVRLSRLYQRLGEQEAVIEVNERLVALQPDKPRFALDLAKTLVESNRLARAEEVLHNVLTNNPGHLETHRWLGELRLRQGRLKEARAEFDNTVLAEPAYAFGWHGLARVYRLMGDATEERRALNQAFEAGLTDAAARLRLGELERKNGMGGLAHFRAVLEQAPESAAGREAAYYLQHPR